MPFGAELDRAAGSTRFRLWAPGAREVALAIGDPPARREAMSAAGDGWFERTVGDAPAGTRYAFAVDGGSPVPDPASRANPDDVHASSEVIDPLAYEWHDDAWRGRPWREAAVYELHVGTFTAEGSFAAATGRLDHLAALGITAIELMPIADFPGRRGWGYDGTLPFAPESGYGTPDDLKRLVDAAHRHGLMVLVDVVYNHFGPEGNYLHAYAPAFFNRAHQTPWGAALNFDTEGSRAVRDFFIHNALYWIEEFHVDGLRLDAVHAIADASPVDLLTELAQAVRDGPGRDREVHLVLENDGNEAGRLRRDARRRPLLYTAQWNDDFHHVMHHLLTGERAGYYADYASDALARLGRCLAEGFDYQGGPSAFRGGERRGEPSAGLPAEAFVNFLQNHDQVGNRAFGERLFALAPRERLRAAFAILLLAPSPPMLFMGDEFGAATPFLYFCDFEPELSAAVRKGRRAEFAGFPPFDDEAAAQSIPDPGDPGTHARSILDWSSVARAPHAQWLEDMRAWLALRRTAIVPRLAHLVPGAATHDCRDGILRVRWSADDGHALVLLTAVAEPGRVAATAPFPPLPPGGSVLWTQGDGAEWRVEWRIEPGATGATP